MYEPLETYLQEVKAQLKALPREAREEEISEIRLHLEAIVNESVKRGENEANAVKFAIAQFGDSYEVGRDLKRAWDGPPEDAVRAIWAGVSVVAFHFACYTASLLLGYGINGILPLFFSNLPSELVRLLMEMRVESIILYRGGDFWGWPAYLILSLIPFLSGWIAGKVAPQRATLAIATVFLTPIVVWALSQNLFDQKVSGIFGILPLWLMTYTGARISVRWKQKHAVRAIQQ